MIPFCQGQLYDRSALLEFVGSKQPVSGIIYGPRQPTCVICTSGGRHSQRVGYEDGPSNDGTWSYIGQGEEGDQDEDTKANRMLADGERTVLMFQTREPTAAQVRERKSYRKSYQFVGAFQVAGSNRLVPTQGPRRGHRLIQFKLAPVMETDTLYQEGSTPKSPLDLAELRTRALRALKAPAERETLSSYRTRSMAVKLYALLRAKKSMSTVAQP